MNDPNHSPEAGADRAAAPPATIRSRRRARRWTSISRYWWRGFRHAIDLDWLPGRRFFRRTPRATLAADARAGLNVALLGLPQSVAFSLVAGVPPLAGLLSNAIGSIVGPFFNGTRFIAIGPSNATAILLLSGLAASGLAPEVRVLALPLFVLMVGGFLVLGAIARASLLINYISRTVVTGYVTAAALLIVANQLPNILGFSIGSASTFLGTLSETIRHLGSTQAPSLLMAGTTLAATLGLRRWAPKLPNIVISLVVAAALGRWFTELGWEIDYLRGFNLTELRILPGVFSFELVGNLAAPALALAFISLLEASAIGKTIAARSGHRLNVNQEMYALGVANLASSLFGGMNASGSLTRSVLSDASGARSPLTHILSGLIVLVLAFTVGPFIRFVPRAALAVLVVSIATSLINRRNLLLALRTTTSDAIVFFVTIVAALLLTIDAAIFLGAFTSIMLFLKKAGAPELVEYNFNPEGHLAALPDAERRNVTGISILHAEGDLFFGSTEIFSQQIRQVIRDPSLQVIILRLKNARNLDASAAIAIEELHDFLKKTQRHLIVSGAGREVTRVLRNSGFLDRLGMENFFREMPSNPTVSTRDALRRAVQLTGRRDSEIRIFVDQTKARKDPDEN